MLQSQVCDGSCPFFLLIYDQWDSMHFSVHKGVPYQQSTLKLEKSKEQNSRLAKYGNYPLFGVYVAPVRDDIGVIRIEDSVMIEM